MTIDVYMPLQKYSCKKKKTNEFEKHGHNSSVLAKGSNTFVIVNLRAAIIYIYDIYYWINYQRQYLILH